MDDIGNESSTRGSEKVPGRPRRVWIAVVSAVAVVAGVAGVIFVLWVNRSFDGVEEQGWSGTAVLCGYDTSANEILDLTEGNVISLGIVKDAKAELEGCRRVLDATDTGDLEFVDDASYFLVATGSDRYDVRLTDADDGSPASLTVEHHKSGDNCPQFAQMRGSLVLVLSGPSDAPVPKVDLRVVDRNC